jgi:hypothetical protein
MGASVNDPVDILFSLYAVLPCYDFHVLTSSKNTIITRKVQFTSCTKSLSSWQQTSITNSFRKASGAPNFLTRKKSSQCRWRLWLSRNSSLLLLTSRRWLARNLPVIRITMGTSKIPQTERRKTRRTLPTNVNKNKMIHGRRLPPTKNIESHEIMRRPTMIASTNGASTTRLGELTQRRRVAWVKNASNSRTPTWKLQLQLSASPIGCPSLPTWSTTWQMND